MKDWLKVRRITAICLALLMSIISIRPTLVYAENTGTEADVTDVDNVAECISNGDLPGEAQAVPEETEHAAKDAAPDNSDILAQTGELCALAKEQPILALVYLNSRITVYEEAAEGSEEVLTIPCGQTVMIEDARFELPENVQDEAERVYNISNLWLYVSFYDHNIKYHGYVEAGNVVTADERFIAWKAELEQTLDKQEKKPAKVLGISSFYPDVEQFPDSYKTALDALKDAHPNWIFVPMQTGIDWNTAIANEIDNSKSLVHKSLPMYFREGSYDNSSWYFASEAALRMYMDPRNSLQENAIFQFEQLTYNESYHSEAALESFLQNTFMNSGENAPGTDMTFARIIQATGAEKNVSPYHLASRIYQEQGAGTSPLISGTYPGFEGFYNYFNVGATGESDEEYIVNGLTWARDHEWNNAYYSIYGGADTISRNYIGRGQDTLYLQKFNMTTNSTFSHQYMQNISAPTSEASNMRKLYASADAIDSVFVFKIPVFENMPEEASPIPTYSTNIALQVPAGYDPTIWLDGIAYGAVYRNGHYIVTAPDNATNAVVYRYNESGVPLGMYVWTLHYNGSCYEVTEQAGLQDLLSYHGFSIRITGKSGIRCKTGISEATKAALLEEGGINGYRLKEYGTLVMNNANRTSYPMIKGGEKVAAGISYGTGADGAFIDKIFETVDGRQRYTAVLVGLPVSQYKTEFAFRGYAVLEKDGQTMILYGPIKYRSIYQLAEQMIATGNYPEGTPTRAFLDQLIRDAQ